MSQPIKIAKLLECKEIEPVTEPSGVVSRLEYAVLLFNGMVLRVRNNDGNIHLIGGEQHAQEKRA